MNEDEALEELGQCVDTIDSLAAAMAMPIPADMHLKALRGSLPGLKQRIKQAYLALGGEDVWE